MTFQIAFFRICGGCSVSERVKAMMKSLLAKSVMLEINVSGTFGKTQLPPCILDAMHSEPPAIIICFIIRNDLLLTIQKPFNEAKFPAL